MFNVSGPEVLIILILALIVLGPDKLPSAARKIGGVMRDIRRVSSGFQSELQSALSEPELRPTPTPPEPMRATQVEAGPAITTNGDAGGDPPPDPGPATANGNGATGTGPSPVGPTDGQASDAA